jgi:ubiquinone/menaquinone biosynthesis C-methylase UbiE
MLAPYRDRVVSSARGRILEIGIGSGLNLPFYASAATEVIGLDPSARLLEMANKAAQKTPIPLRLIEGTAEAIPIEDHDVDAVVTTWTMCSIPEIQRALQEMRRVLRPGGRLFLSRMGARRSRECVGNLVRAADQRQRNGEAEGLGSLQIDDQLDFGGLLDRQIGRRNSLSCGNPSPPLVRSFATY